MLYDIFDKNKPHQCPLGNLDTETCTCSRCYEARKWRASSEALHAATMKNFAPTGSSMSVNTSHAHKNEQKESSREKYERQRKQRYKELQKVDPDNMYWPPYNPLAKEGKKEIHIRYTQDVVETAVLAPEEWKEFFDTLNKTQNIGGAMKGTYDAFDTAKKLGGFGVTAYVKTYNGVDYLILKGYKQHMKTLLAGNRFKASNPQVVKLGLGALDSVKGMARYVKITAPMEILVGSAINVLQYVLNDEYTLRKLGIDEAKLFINVLAVAGTALTIGAFLPAVAATAVGSGIILVASSASVWVLDQLTNFEEKSVEKILELTE